MLQGYFLGVPAGKAREGSFKSQGPDFESFIHVEQSYNTLELQINVWVETVTKKMTQAPKCAWNQNFTIFDISLRNLVKMIIT